MYGSGCSTVVTAASAATAATCPPAPPGETALAAGWAWFRIVTQALVAARFSSQYRRAVFSAWCCCCTTDCRNLDGPPWKAGHRSHLRRREEREE